MKRVLFLSLLASSLVVTALITGCDWSTNDAGFNTSEGAGVSINFSGYYHSTEGGRLVKNTSAGNIVSLTIFPFIAKPLFITSGMVKEEDFLQFIENREKLIPEWIFAILKQSQQ